LYKDDNAMFCVNFKDTALWGSEDFGKGSKIEIKLEFCKEGDVLPAGERCMGIDSIYNFFYDNNLTVFGAYNLLYVDFENYTQPI
jgi:hypothetical protein